MIHPHSNVSLAEYSTMRLGGNAKYLLDITDAKMIGPAVDWAKERNLSVIMIGTGSNIVWTDAGFDGLVLVNKILGIDVQKPDENNAYYTIGSGENWDSVVKRTVDDGYGGLAELSAVPGTTGGTPVQNVGAYGRDVSETLSSLEAYDNNLRQLVTLKASDCQFGYRSSRFNGKDKGRFYITSVTFHVTKDAPKPPFYASLAEYFEQNGISDITTPAIRDAVMAIRRIKLPDPSVVNNNGSFFKNPIVKKEKMAQLIKDYPKIAHWENGAEFKLSAAWLIEHAGYADAHDPATGMATWAAQPLVLVNEHAKTTADLMAFKQKIMDAVNQKFGVVLTQEPETIGAHPVVEK